MITNREEVIDKAFKVFLRMNYEKASISTLAKACGVVKTGVVYYFPHKLDLFMAVADKYVIQMQTPANKFAGPTETLAEFIEQYVAGVSAVMNHIIKQVQCCADDNECCPNFYYFHFLSQVRMYYHLQKRNSSLFELHISMRHTEHHTVAVFSGTFLNALDHTGVKGV